MESERKSKYLVQRAVQVLPADGEGDMRTEPVLEPGVLWEDVATIEVPWRSHRKSVVIAALEQLAVKDDDLPQHYRALDADTADPIPVRLERPPSPPVPPPVRRIG